MNRIPKGFENYKQFILWKPVPKPDGKVDKIPVGAGGAVINPHDATQWLSAVDAVAHSTVTGHGVAFVFTRHDPFFFVDIDDCLQGGQWSTPATRLCNEFAGAAVEVSQSGSGLHIFGSGAVTDERRCKSVDGTFDLYTTGRFAALVGTGLRGDAGTDHTPALGTMVSQYLQRAEGVTGSEWTTTPCEGWTGAEDDTDLIARMQRSSSTGTFDGRASVQQLWEADPVALATAFPPDQGGPGFDHSAADAALCQHLAFWTGKDCARMDRLFRLSALMRDKWELRDDYRENTVLRAASLCNKFYDKPRPADAPDVPAGGGHEMPPVVFISDLLSTWYTITFDDHFNDVFIDGARMDDHTLVRLIMKLNRSGIFTKDVPKARVEIAIADAALSNRSHYFQNKFDSLPAWDGVDRVAAVSRDICGTDDELNQIYMRKWLMGFVARVYNHNPLVKQMLVLSGQQDKGKSSLLRALTYTAPSGFATFNDTVRIDTKPADFWQSIDGCMLVEFAEMVGNKKENVDALKSLISARTVKHRRAYDRYQNNVRITPIFAGTTNDTSILKDATGAVRFFTIKCRDMKMGEGFNVEFITSNLDQIWSQVKHCYDAGEPWYIDDPRVKQMQEDRNKMFVNLSPATEELVEFLNQGPDKVLPHSFVAAKFPNIKRWETNAGMGHCGWIKDRFGAKKDGKTVFTAPYWVCPEVQAMGSKSVIHRFIMGE